MSARLWVANATATLNLRRVFSHSRILAANEPWSRKSHASSSTSKVGRPSKRFSRVRKMKVRTGASAVLDPISSDISKVCQRAVMRALSCASSRWPCGPASV